MSRKSPDVELKPEDIFYIPDNKTKRLSADVINRLAGFGSATASGVLIWEMEAGLPEPDVGFGSIPAVGLVRRAPQFPRNSPRRRASGGKPRDQVRTFYFSVISAGRDKRCFSAVALTLAAGLFGVSKMITPSYEGTATVDIDLRMPAGLLGADSAASPSSLDGDQFMATQMKLIQSDSVLRGVEQKYHLLELEKQDRAALDVPTATFRNAPVFLRKLRVNRPPNTFLIENSYRSPDRELSERGNRQ